MESEYLGQTGGEPPARPGLQNESLSLLNEIPCMIWRADPDTSFNYLNQNWLDFTGRTLQDELGHGWLTGVYPEDSDRVIETYQTAFRAEKPFEMEYRLRYRTGEYRWILDTGRPAYDTSGKLTGYLGACFEMTERKQMEKALHESEALFRGLFEHASDGILAVDQQGQILLINRLGEEMFGYAPGELVGQPVNVLVPDAFQERHRQHMQKYMRAPRPRQIGAGLELYGKRKDGSMFPVDITLGPLRVGDQEWVLATVYDISTRQHTEEQLRQLATRARALAGLSHLLAEMETDIQKVLDTVVVRLAELIGDACTIHLLSPDGSYLVPAALHHRSPDSAALLREMAGIPYRIGESLAGRVAQAGKALRIPEVSLELMRAAIKPEYFPYLEKIGFHSLIVVPLRVRGQVIGTLSISRDQPGHPYTPEDQLFVQDLADRAALSIANARLFESLQAELAEHRRTEEALRESEARFRIIFKESAIGIELKDLEGRIVASNPAMQEMLGYTHEELRRMKFTEFTDPADVRMNDALFHRLMNGEIERYRLDKRYRHKDGRVVWGRQLVSLARDASGQPQFAVAIVENITERREMEAELAEMQRRLLESREVERLQLSQELHDGPLQYLYGLSYQMKSLQGDILSPEVSEQLANLEESLLLVVQDLRAICWDLRPPSLASFGLEKAIRSHAESFERDHPDIKVGLELVDDGQRLPENIRLALFRIYQQAMANVVRHARASYVLVRLEMEAGEARLEVRDNGAGFKLRGRWIDYVRQGHYGLAAAAERARAVGGDLKVTSEVDQGTSVMASVPWTEDGLSAHSPAVAG